MNSDCGLCSAEAVDAIEFETGNNAELSVEVDLCQAHLDEHDATDHAFEVKHYDRILELAEDRLR